MSQLFVYHLSKLVDEETLVKQAKKLRTMRLKSLQMDPQNFISIYDEECDQPLEFTLNRLRPANVQHWIAFRTSKPMSAQKELVVLDQDFVGFFVLLGPDREFGPESNSMYPADLGAPFYQMAAVWLDPEYRGQGLFKQLFQSSVNWVKDQTRDIGRHIAYITTTARQENQHAIGLYSRLGFAIFDDNDVSEKNGRTYKSIRMILPVISSSLAA